MSIVKMQRIAVIGHDTCKSNLIDELIRLEAVEITDQSYKLTDEAWAGKVRPDECQEELSKREMWLSSLNQALDVIEKYGNLKKPLFNTRRGMPESEEKRIRDNAETTADEIKFILDLNEQIHRENEIINRFEQERISLTPWENYDLPVETSETATATVTLGVMQAQSSFEQFEADIGETTPLAIVKSVSEDNDFRYVALMCHKSAEADVQTILKQYGFSPVTFSEIEGTAKENLERIAIEKEQAEERLAGLKHLVETNAGMKYHIEEITDLLLIEMDKLKIRAKFMKTEKAFFIEGWIPEHSIEEVKKILEKNECCYELREPEEGEEVPVLLKNNKFFRPIEAVTEMYSLPAYGSFDPTSIYALFYVCFFGMMFSDAMYGIIMMVACGLILKKFDLEGTTYNMMKGFFYCGVSTFVWGAMFGGWFGNFFDVFAETVLHKSFTIAPIWYNPLDDPLSLLIFSLALGVVHIFIGMGIKAYMQIRDGHIFDAICDEGFWYLTIIGCIMWLAGAYLGLDIAKPGMIIALVGMAGLLLTGGRDRKGFGKVIGGFSNLYNITSYMSDILSYSRILALGLATGVIAQVVNTMGSLFGGGALGCLFLLVVFVVGQTLNFAINVLGAFIHASRLQYVEFFGKFYEDGGEAFDPFRRHTKYIRLENPKQAA